ncbi:hypothetical protein [Streptomyces silvensis]|uniref:Uncharacterized protein n=1 Tax=Streptomyces silvensis TaxID=1765722 RepID=A0A0W7X362_9ACTN|nr:hypothetical protein [Streptomyces silvensis]KUF17185.1 hypothetical protein AT728_15145 [Streptomyces silvensis]
MAERSARSSSHCVSIREKFFAAFSETIEAAGIPHKVISRETGVGLSSISCYKGERVPEEPGPVERIYKVLEGKAREQGWALPHTLAHLLALRTAATVEKTDPGTAQGFLDYLLRGPALETRFRDRRLRTRRRSALLAVRSGVPVPHQRGDRHLTGEKHAADIADYARHVTAGRFRDAQFIAWTMGTSLEPCEFPGAVAAFRNAGAEDGVEAMLSAAAKRHDIQASISTAVALLKEGQSRDAQVLLGAIHVAG